jgi:precorrin-2/cobalt-factor-2 C20-methyltransferase
MSAEVESRAESIVKGADPSLEIRRLVFAIIRDDQARQEAHQRAARTVVDELGAGRMVAFVTLGDPNVYSTFHHLLDEVRRLDATVQVETVPGIMAFQALAAEAPLVVADDIETIRIVTAVDGPEHLESALDDPASTVVVYKGGRHLAAITELLRQRGRLEGAVFGELLGLAHEHVSPLGKLDQSTAAYLSTIIVPPLRNVS